MQDVVIWCSSIKKKNFGWCRGIIGDKDDFLIGSSIQDFADGITKDVSNGYKVALGF